jgi:mono/diheme cytochrome c family protein
MPIPRKSVLLGVTALAVLFAVLSSAAPARKSSDVHRGEYLVKGGGCNDCHTPMKLGPTGPEPDTTVMLAGHPEALVMPPAPALPAGPWLGVFSATNTAWAGPWGVCFTANITPDPDTGIGTWTEQTFLAAIRTGRHMGKGRPILPPMPYQAMSQLTDADLKAIFAYLHSVPSIRNAVPGPVAPQQ